MSKDRGPEYGDAKRPVDTTPGAVEMRLKGWGRAIEDDLTEETARQDELRKELEASEKRCETLQAELDEIGRHLSKMGVQTEWDSDSKG